MAYRLLGSALDAEEVIQDAFLRWHRADRAAIAAPAAWLANVVTNLCLNRLASARVQREQYVGPWLPEANCRQVDRRARRRLAGLRPHFRPETGQWHRLVERFLAAAREGDLHRLEQLLAAEVIAWTDGGGKVTSARRPVVGPARVARSLVGPGVLCADTPRLVKEHPPIAPGHDSEEEIDACVAAPPGSRSRGAGLRGGPSPRAGHGRGAGRRPCGQLHPDRAAVAIDLGRSAGT